MCVIESFFESLSWLWISIGILGAIAVIIGVWGEEAAERKNLPYKTKERRKTAYWIILLSGLSMDLIGLIGATVTSFALESKIEIIRRDNFSEQQKVEELRRQNDALETQLSPRILEESKPVLRLKQYSGIKVVVIFSSAGNDCPDLASAIYTILRGSDWDIEGFFPTSKPVKYGVSIGICSTNNEVNPTFRPLSAENKMDFPGLLSWLFLFVGRSLCARKPFGKERTSRAWHCPSSLSVFFGFPFLPPQAV